MNAQDPYRWKIYYPTPQVESFPISHRLSLSALRQALILLRTLRLHAPHRTPDLPLQTSTLPQRVEDEKDHTMHNPSPGALHALSDNPENLGLMNATITTREIQNFERQILPHQQDVHHEHESAEGMHMIEPECRAPAIRTSRKWKTSSSNSDGQVVDPPSLVNAAPVSQVQATIQNAHAPHVLTDKLPDRHQVSSANVPPTEVLLRQDQLQADARKGILRVISPTSPLAGLPLVLQNHLLANARLEAYTDAEIRVVQIAQVAAVRILEVMQNWKVLPNNADQNFAHVEPAPQGTQTTDIQKPVQTAAVQEPARKVGRTRTWSSSKDQPVRLPMPQSAPSQFAHELSVHGGQAFVSSDPSLHSVSKMTRLQRQDLSHRLSEETRLRRLEKLNHPLLSVQHQEDILSNREPPAHPVPNGSLELPVAGAVEHLQQSGMVNRRKRLVSKKRERDLPPPIHQQHMNGQAVSFSRGTGQSHQLASAPVIHTAAAAHTTSAVDEGMGAPQVSATKMPAVHPSDDITSPRVTTLEQIIQMNGLGVPQRAANPHLSATLNDYSFLVNKYGVKLRFSKSAQASKYCHVCGRSALTTSVTECANLLIGLCQKVICEKCSLLYDPEYGRREEAGYDNSLCMHCKASCPEGIARCFQYRRNNGKRRTRNLERRRKKKESQEEDERGEQENKRDGDNEDGEAESGISSTGLSDSNAF